MDPVGKIKRRRPVGQVFYFPFRGINKNLVDEDIRLDGLQKFFGAAKLAVPFDKLTQPADSFLKMQVVTSSTSKILSIMAY